MAMAPEDDQPQAPARRRLEGLRRVTYPDSPIIIPDDRKEKAKAQLGEIHGLWEQGQHYNSLLTWFRASSEVRGDALTYALLEAGKQPDESLTTVQHEMKSQPLGFALSHYALLSSDAARKLLLPDESEPITEADVNALYYNPGQSDQIRLYRRLGLKDFPFFNADDFTEPRIDISTAFNLEEARQFLLKLTPHIEGEVKRKILSNWGVVSGIRHADLLTDPRLADHLEYALLTEGGSWATYLENFLSQGVFPSTEFFEEAFRRLKPEEANPQAMLAVSIKDVHDTQVPASVFYFTMLRRIASLEKWREKRPEFGQGREERIISYLLNDTFMKHALPYLETDEVFEDNFILEEFTTIRPKVEVKATGEEAKTLKNERFREVLKTAVAYLDQKGDSERLESLKSREVDGVRFADFLT